MKRTYSPFRKDSALEILNKINICIFRSRKYYYLGINCWNIFLVKPLLNIIFPDLSCSIMLN